MGTNRASKKTTTRDNTHAPEIVLVDGLPVVSSLKVAEHFRKRHDDVLKAIRNILRGLPEDFNARNFAGVEYADPKGQSRPAFNLTRDGFTILVMGFTGYEAMAWKVKYIEAFNAMEKELQRRKQLELRGHGKKGQRFLFSESKRMDPVRLVGIKGWLDYWCYSDNLEYEDAIQQFCTVLQVKNLDDVLESDTTCAYNFIWWSLFKIREKSGDDLTAVQHKGFYGLLTFWEKCLGEDRTNIEAFVCTKCNVQSLSEIKQHALHKAFTAAYLGIFRHIFCNIDDNVYKL